MGRVHRSGLRLRLAVAAVGAAATGDMGAVLRAGARGRRGPRQGALALWRRHLELDVIAAHPLRVDVTATRAELARRGERASADLAAAGVIDLAGYQCGDR